MSKTLHYDLGRGLDKGSNGKIDQRVRNGRIDSHPCAKGDQEVTAGPFRLPVKLARRVRTG